MNVSIENWHKDETWRKGFIGDFCNLYHCNVCIIQRKLNKNSPSPSSTESSRIEHYPPVHEFEKTVSPTRNLKLKYNISNIRLFVILVYLFAVISGSRDTFLATKYRDKIDNNFEILFDVDLKVILPKLREKSQSFHVIVYRLLPHLVAEPGFLRGRCDDGVELRQQLTFLQRLCQRHL